jgi:hypothetical protein
MKTDGMGDEDASLVAPDERSDTLVAQMQHVCYAPCMTVSDQLRKAVRQTGQSARVIAQGSGIALTVLTRFMARKTTMRTDNVDLLASYLRLELKARKGS